MAAFEGTLKIRLHPVKGITLSKGDSNSTLTADDAASILKKMVSAAETHKVGIDRWSLYIPEVALSMTKDVKQLTLKQIKPFLEGTNHVPTVTQDRFKNPRLVLAAPMTVTKRKSNIIDIA
jgi:ribonuclease I